MGLKSGSRDAGLDESDEATEAEGTSSGSQGADADAGGARGGAQHGDTGPVADAVTGSEPDSGPDRTDPAGAGEGAGEADHPSMAAIPYKLRRDKVNEGRDQVPFFLREEVLDGEDDLRDALEALLGEHVYKSDYREAAMVAAQRNPELVAEVLREWGYDLD